MQLQKIKKEEFLILKVFKQLVFSKKKTFISFNINEKI